MPPNRGACRTLHSHIPPRVAGGNERSGGSLSPTASHTKIPGHGDYPQWEDASSNGDEGNNPCNGTPRGASAALAPG